ncbi:MAG: hypothetical protein HC790_04330 [Acaryochloridaceae cyanobacterium CSU_3_4]|nr:hypothetical protein [Acaryochloridaceae cyanobacterium CSU_3_4]
MKSLRILGSFTTLSLVVLHNTINIPVTHAAQLGLGDSLEEEINLKTNIVGSDVCAEEAPVVSPEALQEPANVSQSLSLGSHLMANVAATDVNVNSQPSPALIAQDVQFEDCAIGGIAPEGGLPAAAGFPLAAALIPAGAAAIGIPLALGGSDDPGSPSNPPDNNPPPLEPIPPNVPEPAEAATAGLFACLGITGVIARRRMNRVL